MSANGVPACPAGLACETARRTVKVCNKLGLHSRASAKFVKTATQFDSEIWVRKNGTTVPGRDILELLMLEAPTGTPLEIIATGRDAAAAVDALVRLIERKFDED